MTQLAPWQRTLYFLGEVVMVAGLLWALYIQFITRACAVGLPGVFQPFTVVITGIALDTVPLHPFGAAIYLRPGLRRSAAGILWWALSLIGLGFALYSLITAVPGPWWIAALVPAFLWYWGAVPSRTVGKPIPPAKAPPPPEGAREITDEMDNDDPDETPDEEGQQQR